MDPLNHWRIIGPRWNVLDMVRREDTRATLKKALDHYRAKINDELKKLNEKDEYDVGKEHISAYLIERLDRTEFALGDLPPVEPSVWTDYNNKNKDICCEALSSYVEGLRDSRRKFWKSFRSKPELESIDKEITTAQDLRLEICLQPAYS